MDRTTLKLIINPPPPKNSNLIESTIFSYTPLRGMHDNDKLNLDGRYNLEYLIKRTESLLT